VAESPQARPAVFAGLDVGKGHHHLCALDLDGQRLVDEVVVNDEAALRGVLERLRGRGGPVLLVVDQPASIGALPVAVARQIGLQVAYLPGLAMRRLADLHPGEVWRLVTPSRRVGVGRDHRTLGGWMPAPPPSSRSRRCWS